MSDANRTALRYSKESQYAEAIGGAYASQTIALGGVGVANDTVVVNGLTYTLKASVSTTAREVKIGATAALTAKALSDAINGLLSTKGTLFGSLTEAHTTVIARVSGSTVTVYAIAHGTAGNAYTLTEVGTSFTVGGATFAGGLASNVTAMKELRVVRHSLKHNKVTVESEEIRSDRTSSGLVKVGISAGGDALFESHFTDLNDFRQSAVMQPAVTGSSTQAIFTISSVGVLTITGGGTLPAAMVKAKFVKIAGFLTAANNGLHRVISSTSTSMTLEGVSAEADGESVTVSWAYSRQGNGEGITLESYLMETQLSDAGIVIPIQGMCVNTWALSLQPRARIMETFGFVGYGLPSGTLARTDTCGASVTSPSTNPIINTTANIARLLGDGDPMDAYVSQLEFNVNNNVRERLAISREGTLEPGTGQSAVTGSLLAYFDSREMYDDYLRHTGNALEFTLQDADGRIINVYLPKIQQTDGTYDVPGINQDVFLNLAYKAERGVGHDGTEFQMQVDFLSPS